MTKNQKILLIIASVFCLVIISPLTIAIYKSWRAGLTDAINWDGRIKP